jgi:hypothetical protein
MRSRSGGRGTALILVYILFIATMAGISIYEAGYKQGIVDVKEHIRSK